MLEGSIPLNFGGLRERRKAELVVVEGSNKPIPGTLEGAIPLKFSGPRERR